MYVCAYVYIYNIYIHTYVCIHVVYIYVHTITYDYLTYEMHTYVHT